MSYLSLSLFTLRDSHCDIFSIKTIVLKVSVSMEKFFFLRAYLLQLHILTTRYFLVYISPKMENIVLYIYMYVYNIIL